MTTSSVAQVTDRSPHHIADTPASQTETVQQADTLRTAGQDQATDSADSRVVALIDSVIEAACKSGREFSCNDVRAQLPTTTSPGLVGARFDRARKQGRMRWTGERVRSTLPSTRSAWISVWIGA